MRPAGTRTLWVWRGLGLGLVLVLLSALVWLAGKAGELEARAWARTITRLESQARALPSPLRDELQAALVCVNLRHEAGLLDPRASGDFLREARSALADGALDAQEGQRLVLAARAACGARS